MKIAILSGKGGTGKTFVSVNLASVMEQSTYVDCDVEEPNGNLFFKSDINDEKIVNVIVPKFNENKCTGCKECVEFCAFNALAFIQSKPMLFPEVCHSCGGCSIVCKHDAVDEIDKEVGRVFIGTSSNVEVLSGIMRLGEVSGVPIIKELLKNIPSNHDTIIDCPPGSGCMVMESIKDVDYCVLVAEPTEFGKHNLQMVYELTKVFNKKVGIILNKCTNDFNPSKEFCISNNIDIIGEIPYDNNIGKDNSNGEIIVNKDIKTKAIFDNILLEIRRKVIS